MLPKVFLIPEKDIDKKIEISRLEDEVAKQQKEIAHFLKRPAMWVGSTTNFEAIIIVLIEKMSWMAHLCKSLGLHYYWSHCKFGSLGPHSMRYVGKWPDQKIKDPETFMQDLATHVDKFYKWIPNNLVLIERDIELPQYADEHCHMNLPPDEVLTDLPEIVFVHKEFEEVLLANNADMTHVFTEIGWIGAKLPHIKFVALNRPINAKHHDTIKAKKLGFK